MTLSRGMPMVGALVRDCSKIMRIVTAYKCDAKGEYIQFAGDGPTTWCYLDDFEILSMEE